jgi:hypothetical protein
MRFAPTKFTFKEAPPVKIKLPTLHHMPRWIKVAVPVAALGLQLAVPAAEAGPAGVFLNDSSYFIVQDVSLSSGTDAAYLQFGLKLQNGSQSDINMNDYGVRVSDASGHSFSAQLTSKQAARVTAGQAATFRFSSEVPSQESLDQLQVVVFRWETSESDLMDDLGALPVAGAVTSGPVRETIVQADEADDSLPTDAAVSFRAVRSFVVHQDEQSYLYADVLATNTGSTSFSLPAALKYRFTGTKADSYNAAIVAGTDGPLLPGDTRKVTVRAAIPSGEPNAQAGYSLQFYSEGNGGVSVLGSLDVASVATQSVIGEAEPVFNRDGVKQLSVTVTNATTSQQSDGVHVSAAVTVRNDSADVAALPPLTAAFQFGSGGSAVAATDAGSHPLYLAANDTSLYNFEAVLPSGMKADDVRLAVFAGESAGSNGGSGGGKSSGSASGASSSSGGTGTSLNASSSTAGSGSGSGAAKSNSGGGSGNGTSGGESSGGASSGASGSTSTGTSSNTASSSSSSAGAAVATGGNAPVAVAVLSGATDGSNLFFAASSYKLGDILPVADGVFSSDLDMSLVEFGVNPEDEDGFRNGFAKFVVTNKGKNAVELPNFAADLVAKDGATYTGSRQSAAAQQVMPGTSYVVDYSFLIPSTLDASELALTVADGRSGAKAANVAVSPQSIGVDGNVLKVYPFTVTLNSTALQWTYSSGTFTYKLSLDLKLERQAQVIVDGNSSSLEFDLVDGLGRTLASQALPFTGTNKLIDGLQSVSFGGFKDVSEPLSVRVYETFTTGDGTVKRLLKDIQNP